MAFDREDLTTESLTRTNRYPLLPRSAQLPINRCNLPAIILGGLTFQKDPSALLLDGVDAFHGRLFREHLATLEDPRARALRFVDYLDVAFRLCRPEELGFEPSGREKRIGATCLSLIRGWCFDSNGREGAVLKGWVESRFGLLARFHGGSLQDRSSEVFLRYLTQRAEGVFGTAAIENQLDVLYTFCQYEFCQGGRQSLLLYRGISRLSELEVIEWRDSERCYVLLNNLTSFTSERERAEEFGHFILESHVPTSKVMFRNRLIPHLLSGEDEYMVIGGLYEVTLSRY
jgi:NAD+---dinitrogen-reductase ADP-D-ribosyltransferase